MFTGSLVLLLLSMQGSPTRAWPEQDRQTPLNTFEKVYHEVLNRYVTEVDAGKLAEAGIRGMLSELDPYTQFIVESNAQRIEDLTHGEYGGVGIRLGKLGDSLLVVSPMEGTPAQRYGVQAGDVIIRIDSLRTRRLSLNEAARLVRGPVGTRVSIRVKRGGVPEPITFDLDRELILVPDVSYSGLLEPGLGYVKLATFSKFTAEHVEQAVRKLRASGLQGLILDLRGNPGGLLSAALRTVDLFIPKGELLLQTQGRIARSNHSYIARRSPILRESTRMIVLIDRGSASASEIVSGILQDYDRAVILGQTSFGKGLVQTIYNIEEGVRLKVTTAKYYLPSGRLIQRIAFGEEVRLEELLEPDSLEFSSAHARGLKGGGGIRPDVEIPAYIQEPLEAELWRRGAFFRFAVEFNNTHPGGTLPFQADSTTLHAFSDWLGLEKTPVETNFSRWLDSVPVDSQDTWLEEQDSVLELISQLQHLSGNFFQEKLEEQSDRIQRALEMEISSVRGGSSARVAAGLKGDPVLETAARLLQTPGAVDDLLQTTALTIDRD